jgi:hypothetical protein
MVKHERVSLPQAKEKINQISEQLLNLADQCRGFIAAGGGENQDVNLYRGTQTKLCNEVRVLVASSKLLVQAAAEVKIDSRTFPQTFPSNKEKIALNFPFLFFLQVALLLMKVNFYTL